MLDNYSRQQITHGEIEMFKMIGQTVDEALMIKGHLHFLGR